MENSTGRNPLAGTLVVIVSLSLIALGAGMVLDRDGSASSRVAGDVSRSIPVENEDVDFGRISSWGPAASGREIQIKGRLHRCDGSEQWLPGGMQASTGEFVLYRFVNTCCPGHSVPAVVLLSDPDHALAAGIEQDQWVSASGVFQLAEGQLPSAPATLQLHSMHVLEQGPADPSEQLFPPSKMGAPCAGSRPDVPYPPR